MSQFFDWSNNFSVHNKKMDNQHKLLIEYINGFYEVAESGNLTNCIKSFENIVSYTTYHFQDEERMLERANYPSLDGHKKVHQQLVVQVIELGDKLADGKKSAPTEIKLFLKDWLSTHIRGIDMKYAEYVADDAIFRNTEF